MSVFASVKRMTLDLRYLNKKDKYTRFRNDLDKLLKQYNITILKESVNDSTEKYLDDTVLEVCPNCNVQVRAYSLREGYCMNCGKKIYPCSLCNTCTDECKITGGTSND